MSADTQLHSRLREVLNAHFEERVARNSRYSLRSFAKHLGIDPSLLSKVMRGERRCSLELANKINALDIKQPTKVNEAKLLSDLDQTQLLADWVHFAVLELMASTARPCEKTALENWLADRLNVSRERTHVVIDRLLRLTLIVERDDILMLNKNAQHTTTVTDKAHTTRALREYQQSMLALSSQSLDKVALEARDHSSMLFTFDPKHIDEAKAFLKQARREFMGKFETKIGTNAAVYALNLGFFPISKPIVPTKEA